MDILLAPAISFAFSQLVLSVLLLKHKQQWSVQQRLYLLLLLAIAAYLSLPVFESSAWFWIPASLTVAVPGTFWLFCASLFDDHFYLQRWQLALVGYTVLFPLCGRFLNGYDITYLDTIFFSMPQAMEFVVLGLALYVVARHWRVDLVESRRHLRIWFCGLNGGYLFVFILFREILIPDAQWLKTLQYVFAGFMLLASNAILLRYRDSVWGGKLNTPVVADNLVLSSPGVQRVSEESVVDKALVNRLETLMDTQKAYREMGLTIGGLARQLDIPEYRLRRLINSGMGYRNFNDYLNRYRVKEASQLLCDPERCDQQILSIALDTGFRSLSSFNKAFKDTYQLTPTAYRRSSSVEN